jgi:hypothetical protein
MILRMSQGTRMRRALTIISVGLLLTLSAGAADRAVAFNTESKKYHLPSCDAAKRCTVNCITIPLSQALAKGGSPCKRCNPPTR